MTPGVLVLAVLALIAAALVARYLLATTVRLVLALAVMAGIGVAVYRLDAPTSSWIDQQRHAAEQYAAKVRGAVRL